MTATSIQPTFSAQTPSIFASIRAAITEPFLVIAVSAFWLLVLPFAALFSGAIAFCDKVKELKMREVRFVWSYQFGFRAETRPLQS